MASNRNELTCNCAEQLKADRDKAVEESFAMTLYKDVSLQCKRLFVIVICELIAILGIVGGFIWYMSLYDFSNETTTIEAVQDGDNNIANGGDLTYGTESQDNQNTYNKN